MGFILLSGVASLAILGAVTALAELFSNGATPWS